MKRKAKVFASKKQKEAADAVRRAYATHYYYRTNDGSRAAKAAARKDYLKAKETTAKHGAFRPVAVRQPWQNSAPLDEISRHISNARCARSRMVRKHGDGA